MDVGYLNSVTGLQLMLLVELLASTAATAGRAEPG